MLRLAVSLLLAASCYAQTIGFKHVAITGNSIAQMQGGFQSWEYPLLPKSYVTIFGQYSFTCANLLPLIPYLVPVNADVAVLYEAGTDVRRGFTPADHIACMESTVAVLQARNPNLIIVLANMQPWTQGNCYGDSRDLIDAYNAAYASEQWPAGVQVVDVWTPNILQDGSRWADPNDITGTCGVHPGPANVWTWSWAHFTAPVTQAVNRMMH